MVEDCGDSLESIKKHFFTKIYLLYIHLILSCYFLFIIFFFKIITHGEFIKILCCAVVRHPKYKRGIRTTFMKTIMCIFFLFVKKFFYVFIRFQ